MFSQVASIFLIFLQFLFFFQYSIINFIKIHKRKGTFMIARQIKPEEVKRTEELFSISFDSPYTNELSPSQLYDKYISSPKSRGEEHCLERFAAFEDDDSTMMSSFIMHPYHVRFDGHNESMFSIGGVATLPQYRKRGGIRACFEKALPHLYESGAVFSYLYPFSTAYYRKFGYEICYRKAFYQVALAHIPAFSPAGSCYLLETATAASAARDIPYIYDIWQNKYNMMVQGESYDYSFIGSANPYKEQEFTYIYRSAANEPMAYMTFRNNTAPDCRQLECSSFFYINMEGLQGLLALARSFSSDYRHICFNLPPDCPLEPVLPEWSMGAVSCSLKNGGMVRVVNAAQVLQDASYLGSGSLTLQITDPYIIKNNGIYDIIFTDGACTSISTRDTLASSGADTDVSLSISAFSVLITGGYDTGYYTNLADVTVYGNEENIRKVFYKKPVYITALF